MEKKYVNEGRYKKVSRSPNRKRGASRGVSSNIKKNKIKKIDNVKKKKSYKRRNGKVLKLIISLFLLAIILFLSRLITKENEEPFIPVFFQKSVQENNENIRIAIFDDINFETNNVILTELEQYVYPMLLRIGKDYNIRYEVCTNIEKINNKEYDLKINTDIITALETKIQIDKIINDKSKYYYKVENVESIEVKNDETLLIKLKEEDEYFVYNLEIPIYIKDSDYSKYKIISQDLNKKLVLQRTEKAPTDLIKQIEIIKVNNEQIAIDMYKELQIDVFFSNSENTMKMLGKYEYDVKSYNSGEGIYLMFNPESQNIKEKYIRQAIVYSIDRENLLKEVAYGKGKVIDLPYIYDENKYKYDIYATENLLKSNNYSKIGSYYTKDRKRIVLTMLVNKEDNEKLEIAKMIKTDLAKMGIELKIEECSVAELEKKKEKNEYDLMIASLYINENPNIKHFYDNLVLNDKIKNEIQNLKLLETSKLQTGIKEIRNALSEEVSIAGIYSKNTYVIYRKGIDVFKNINYMNLFYEYMYETQ
ncbi:MAG: ABC transporter substrate-binding protein [Clostridia bacterium]|nr:ABC transporter substrate-binding protein [Clostridia bacterium]